jgi:hypothetical protein
MDYDTWRPILFPIGVMLFWLLVVGPIVWLIGRLLPDSPIKRFLFKQR